MNLAIRLLHPLMARDAIADEDLDLLRKHARLIPQAYELAAGK